MIYTAGNDSEKDRSDCKVTFELQNSGGLEIEIKSKVAFAYGRSIRELATRMLKFFEIEHASLLISDQGALPFVLAARIEAVIKKARPSNKAFLLPFLPENTLQNRIDRRRVTRLFLPGNTPSLMINAGIHSPDAVILDLEDAVAAERKFEAAFVVRNALRCHSFLGAERMVRINQLPAGLDDLQHIVPQFVQAIIIPKCEKAEQVHLVNQTIENIKSTAGLKHNIWLIPLIESALGVANAPEIALAAQNIAGLIIGLEDYCADIGAVRTIEGHESFVARSWVLNACKAAGIQAHDSVFADVANIDALKTVAQRSKTMGFDGMGCIHPRQIAPIVDSFAPTTDEIEQAIKIIKAFEQAKLLGLGVVSLGTKMIDPPVVLRAQRIIDWAVDYGKLDVDWNAPKQGHS